MLEGDQATARDAERIRAAGGDVVQINTGTGCHLDPMMVSNAMRSLAPPVGSLVFIENVGNLVCPALFDLGEEAKVVVLSVTEGDDKPIKYPNVFAAATLLVLTKIDLAPHVPFEIARCIEHARSINPHGSASCRSPPGPARAWTRGAVRLGRRAPRRDASSAS